MSNAQQMIMAVDDEPGILRMIQLELEGQGLRVVTAPNGHAAIELAMQERPDLAVLDIVMPGMSGLELMAQLRETGPLPVILLTAKDSNSDRVRGLDLGADDYLGKPFSPEELVARIRSVLRRSSTGKKEDIFRIDNLEIDLSRRLVRRDGDIVSLTRNEWTLLQCLATNAGKTMLNGDILSTVWGQEYRGDLQYLRVWVSRLRQKLEVDPSNPRLIRTVPGVGYTFTLPAGSIQEPAPAR